MEGVFVKDEYRNRGIGKNLVLQCEIWAKKKGCSEFASDCELSNSESLNFHLHLGFQEANRIICFKKSV
ncbi:GNAT family N-acetyltransferase [Anaerocolumna sp. AGMB13025]|uniref:GNAT family N-acetyltransferase n=1 Tax=Anaerocolumna sp. AGMB13025 TaxID=3039116 RepID=UPI00241CAA76|nr:GNAT family N-acetyltransferase [Anaerocolumna sp. AGMB13025]WFR59576.1 GNAT family N-acetyltransferase [Anaerocolumna sp. AGMB13025]